MLNCCKAPSSWKRTSLSGVICLMLPTSLVSNLQGWPVCIELLDWAKWPNLSLLSLWLLHTPTFIRKPQLIIPIRMGVGAGHGNSYSELHSSGTRCSWNSTWPLAPKMFQDKLLPQPRFPSFLHSRRWNKQLEETWAHLASYPLQQKKLEFCFAFYCDQAG